MPKLFRHLFFLILLTIGYFVVAPTSYAQDDPNKDFALHAHAGSQTGTVVLTWTDKDYVESYNIAYGPSAGNYLYGVTNVGNINSYTIGGLTPGQTYYFVLSPVDDGSALAYTSEVSAVAAGQATSTPAQPQQAVQGGTGGADTMVPPGTPQPVSVSGNDEDKNFHVSANTGTSAGTVKLTWDNKGYVENYNIAYGPQPGNYVWGASGVGHVGEYTIGALNPGQTYYFVLSAVDDNVAFPYTPYVAAVASR